MGLAGIPCSPHPPASPPGPTQPHSPLWLQTCPGCHGNAVVPPQAACGYLNIPAGPGDVARQLWGCGRGRGDDETPEAVRVGVL